MGSEPLGLGDFVSEEDPLKGERRWKKTMLRSLGLMMTKMNIALSVVAVEEMKWTMDIAPFVAKMGDGIRLEQRNVIFAITEGSVRNFRQRIYNKSP